MATLAGYTLPQQETRAERATAMLVDDALVIADALGTPAAAAWLQQLGISLAVTVRVLREPGKRRPAQLRRLPALR
jgi:hypothetical protein